MKVLEANILDMPQGIICHQVNCVKKAGAGLALQIRNKWPVWYEHFRHHDGKLGDFYLQPVPGKLNPNGSHNLIVICDLYAQYGVGRSTRQTNYGALEVALRSFAKILVPNTSVYLPYGMGAGLGGGELIVILGIIRKIIPTATLVKFPTPERG